MKIHDGSILDGGNLRPHFQTQQSQPSVGQISSPGVSGASEKSTSIEGLTALLAGGTEVRESLVQEIKLKIQAGEYLSQKSAVETADAILNL